MKAYLLALLAVFSLGWEIVQLVGLQTLDLAILVRVQVSQPKIRTINQEVVDLWWKMLTLK